MPQATDYVQGNREFRQGLNTNVTIVYVCVRPISNTNTSEA